MIKRTILSSCAASVMLLVMVGFASASTFTIGAGSSVSLTPLDEPLSGYTTGVCITESLAAGLVGYSFDLNTVGDSETFDFLTFTANGFGFYQNYSAIAALAFDTPTIAASSGGSATVVGIGFGGFAAGLLAWNDVPVDVAFGTSGIVTIDFQGGTDFLTGAPVTTSATVTLVQEDLAAVPLPAGVLLLMTGLGGIAALRRKKKAS